MSIDTRTIDLGTHRLRVRDRGTGQRTFLCLHDFLESAESWDALAAGLSEDGRVIALQQRGHGISTAPVGRCDLRDLSADVAAVLDATGVGRVLVIGEGIGATVALSLALASPGRVAGLALISPVVALDERAAREWAQIVRAGEVNKLQGLARSVWGPMSRREADGDGAALTEIARAVYGLHAEPIATRLADVGCPTLVLARAGDARDVERAREVAARVPRARFDTLPQRGGGREDEAGTLLRLVREHLGGAQ